jgi:hypothetical protein
MGRNILLDLNQGEEIIINLKKNRINILKFEKTGPSCYHFVLDIDNEIVEAIYNGTNFDIINFINLEAVMKNDMIYLM